MLLNITPFGQRIPHDGCACQKHQQQQRADGHGFARDNDETQYQARDRHTRGDSADDWHLSLFGVQLDDVLVYRREEALMVESERAYFFSWADNPDYRALCADYDVPMPQLPPGTMLGEDVWVVPPPTWPDDHVFTLDEYHLIVTPGMVTQRFTMPITACHWLPHRLTVGQLARVTPGTPNRLRATPSTRGDILDLMPGGTVLRVLDGPICAEDFSWWQVDYNGVIGWTVEGMNFDYWLEPAR